MRVSKQLLMDMAIEGGFIDCLNDLPYSEYDIDNYEKNIEYMQETLARYYMFVQQRTARNRDFKRGEKE